MSKKKTARKNVFMISKFKKNNYNVINLNKSIELNQKKNFTFSKNKNNGCIAKNCKNKDMEIDSDLNESLNKSISFGDKNIKKIFKIGNESFHNIDTSYGDNYSTANSNVENDKKRQNKSSSNLIEYIEKPKIAEMNDSFEISEENEQEPDSDIDTNLKKEEEYLDDILENLLYEEENNKFKINPDYFKVQHEINYKMRIILIDWLLEVNEKLKFKDETFYSAIYIIDAYLSKKFIPRKKFQLLGVTALYISTKLNEIFSGRVKDYALITDCAYNEKNIIDMESDICKTLNFNFLIPTCLSFFQIFSKKIGFDANSNEYKFGKFIIQNFLMSIKSFNYNYSAISIATCNILLKLFEKETKLNNFDLIIYNPHLIENCSKNICEAINELINSKMNLSISKYYNGDCFDFIKKLIYLYNS